MVLCSGVFDGLHAGHVAYLQAAARLCQDGERLMVAVAPDAYVVQHKHRQPRWSAADRVMTVRALKIVDAVRLHGDAGVEDVILASTPRLFVKAEDWKDRLTVEVLAACSARGTSILFIPERATPHTSEAIH